MSQHRIDKKTLQDQLPVLIRENNRADNFEPDHLPSWKYISENTRYSAEALNKNCERLFGITLHEFLRREGFGCRSDGKWPTNHERTIQSLEYFIYSLEQKRDYKSTETVESIIHSLYKAINEENLKIEILELGRFEIDSERVENIQNAIQIIQNWDKKYKESTMGNYTEIFSKYYKIVKNRYRIDFNPVEEALVEFEWNPKRPDPTPVSIQQFRDFWNTLEELEECPIQRYDLDEWRLWMKALLIFMLAVGPRSSEIESVDITQQIEFGDDPHVYFHERKNLKFAPDKVPIMFGCGFLKAYVDYILLIDGNGKLVRSNQSESGSRTPATLNEWIKRISKRANIRLEDGSIPTIQNFRQLWKNLYKEALHENRRQVELIAQDAGTQNPEVVEESYIANERNRRHIRELGRKHFEEVLEINELPVLLTEKLDQNEYISRQTTVTNF